MSRSTKIETRLCFKRREAKYTLKIRFSHRHGAWIKEIGTGNDRNERKRSRKDTFLRLCFSGHEIAPVLSAEEPQVVLQLGRWGQTLSGAATATLKLYKRGGSKDNTIRAHAGKPPPPPPAGDECEDQRRSENKR